MREPIGVGLGEKAISRHPEDVLVAYGLGSCLGVTMIDPVTKVSGLVHAVLPKATDGGELSGINPYKYVESGIEGLLMDMVAEGANRSRLVIRIAGGANMLTAAGLSQSFNIGTRNIEIAKTTFSRLKLPVQAAEVGGNIGRTVRVYVGQARVTVRVIGEKEHDL